MQKLGLGEEGSPSGEKADIDKVTEIEVRLLQKAAKKPMPRSQHPKQHGCVWAEFTVVSQKQGSDKVGKLKTPTLLFHVYSLPIQMATLSA